LNTSFLRVRKIFLPELREFVTMQDIKGKGDREQNSCNVDRKFRQQMELKRKHYFFCNIC
jgi:hypothetical protein